MKTDSRWIRKPLRAIVALFLWTFLGAVAWGQEPWIITTPTTVSEPRELGETFVAAGGVLTIINVPEPGLQIRGNLWVADGGRLHAGDIVSTGTALGIVIPKPGATVTGEFGELGSVSVTFGEVEGKR